MSSSAQRVVGWLVLGAAFLAALGPAQALVLCVEPDGCVSVELASSAGACAPCGDHEPGDGPVRRGPAASSVTSPGAEGSACPCLDLALPGLADEHRVPSRAAERDLAPRHELTPASLPPQAAPAVFLDPARTAARASAPARADDLARLASVVLRI